MKRWVNVLALLAIAVCSVAILPYVHGISAEEAAAAVAGADNALQSAFVTVSDTEKVGVNMSSLMSRLNEAGLYLNMAEEALNGGNYSAAVNEAATSEALAVGVAQRCCCNEEWSCRLAFEYYVHSRDWVPQCRFACRSFAVNVVLVQAIL